MPPARGAAQLFVDRNFTGASAILDTGNYNIEKLSARDSVGNDTVSSIRVAPGYVVVAYTDADFGGASKTFIADAPYVGDDFNDLISSVKVGLIGEIQGSDVTYLVALGIADITGPSVS